MRRWSNGRSAQGRSGRLRKWSRNYQRIITRRRMEGGPCDAALRLREVHSLFPLESRAPRSGKVGEAVMGGFRINEKASRARAFQNILSERNPPLQMRHNFLQCPEISIGGGAEWKRLSDVATDDGKPTRPDKGKSHLHAVRAIWIAPAANHEYRKSTCGTGNGPFASPLQKGRVVYLEV